MEVIYRSTRSNSEPVTASQAILKGLSDDGGTVCTGSYSHTGQES